MFEGEKTVVFWVGLIILGLASVGLFGILWMIVVWNGYPDRFQMLKQAVPVIVGGAVFSVIGLYMMASGVKKKVASQARNKDKSEEETKSEGDLNEDTFVSKMGALLDLFSDRAVAHASFFVASIFGIVTVLAIIQQINENHTEFVWLSTVVFYGISYAGFFALSRFHYYATIAHRLSYEGIKRSEVFKKIILGDGEKLQAYMDRRSKMQAALFFPKTISYHSDKWYIRFLSCIYWLAIYFLGSIAYSEFWGLSALAIWLALLSVLLPFSFLIMPRLVDCVLKSEKRSAFST